MAEKASFRRLLPKNRCLVAVDGYIYDLISFLSVLIYVQSVYESQFSGRDVLNSDQQCYSFHSIHGYSFGSI